MKYLNKYKQFYEKLLFNADEFNAFYAKLEQLFNIIGFKMSHKENTSMFRSLDYYSIRIDTNLNAIEGSIARCLLLAMVKEYEDIELIKMYQSVGNVIYPIDDSNSRITQIGHMVEKDLNSEYKEFLKIICNELSGEGKVIRLLIQPGLKTVSNYIFNIICDILRANTNLNEDIVLPVEQLNKFLEQVTDYKLINEIRKNQPVLFSRLNQINNFDSAADMDTVGF